MGNGDKKRLRYNAFAFKHITEDIETQGFQWLAVSPFHARTALELGNHHKDLFDRLLIAQASYEGLQVVTYDVGLQL